MQEQPLSNSSVVSMTSLKGSCVWVSLWLGTACPLSSPGSTGLLWLGMACPLSSLDSNGSLWLGMACPLSSPGPNGSLWLGIACAPFLPKITWILMDVLYCPDLVFIRTAAIREKVDCGLNFHLPRTGMSLDSPLGTHD